MLSKSGVYKITCVATGKFYIGSAVVLRRRRDQHFSSARMGNHKNEHLQSAWNKYGEDAFRFEVILVCKKEQVVFYEQRCLDALRPEFNKDPVAGSRLGSKHTEEAKKKMAAAKIGKKVVLSEESRRARAESTRKASLKRWGDPEKAADIGEKISSAKMNNPWSDEQSAAAAERLRGNKHRVGAKLPKESVDKMLEKRFKKRYEFMGVMMSSWQLAELSAHDLTGSRVGTRLARGWTVEDAIGTPKNRNARSS